MKIWLICVCVPCSLSEVARRNIRTSHDKAVKENGRKLQVPRYLLGWMIVVIPNELTSLIHRENEASLYLCIPNLCYNLRIRFPQLCSRSHECFSILVITPCLL